MRMVPLLVGASLLAPTAGFAQGAAENYSYRAPSGMFGSGTEMWNYHRQRTEDEERMKGLSTGSVQPGAINDQTTSSPAAPPKARRRR